MQTIDARVYFILNDDLEIQFMVENFYLDDQNCIFKLSLDLKLRTIFIIIINFQNGQLCRIMVLYQKLYNIPPML